MYPTRGCRAVRVARWVRAVTVGTRRFVGAAVPILSLVSVCAVTAVRTAGYPGTVGDVAVSLAAWVMSLYSGTFVDFL